MSSLPPHDLKKTWPTRNGVVLLQNYSPAFVHFLANPYINNIPVHRKEAFCKKEKLHVIQCSSSITCVPVYFCCYVVYKTTKIQFSFCESHTGQGPSTKTAMESACFIHKTAVVAMQLIVARELFEKKVVLFSLGESL